MTRPEILDEAKRCVCGQREQDYGSPERNFERIADLWNAYLGKNTVDPVDVAMMLALLKVAPDQERHGNRRQFCEFSRIRSVRRGDRYTGEKEGTGDEFHQRESMSDLR